LVSGIHPHKAKLDSRLRGNDERKDDVLELKLTKCVRSGNDPKSHKNKEKR